MSAPKKTSRRRPKTEITELSVGEVSLVDDPAVQDAKFVIVKRLDPADSLDHEDEVMDIAPESIDKLADALHKRMLAAAEPADAADDAKPEPWAGVEKKLDTLIELMTKQAEPAKPNTEPAKAGDVDPAIEKAASLDPNGSVIADCFKILEKREAKKPDELLASMSEQLGAALGKLEEVSKKSTSLGDRFEELVGKA